MVPTISDVAKRAGVSPATVSRVIRGAQNVHPATRKKVERAIEELGYVPSAVAQSLRSKRTRSLALVVSDITNNFWTTIARGVEDVAHHRGYSLLLGNTDESLARQAHYLDFLIRQQVDGIIIAPYDSDAHNLDKLRTRNIPTVVIDRRIRDWDVDSVRGDSVSGARALVKHLIQLGHTRIAVISGPSNTSTAEDRIAGYYVAMTDAGVPVDPSLVKRGEFRSQSGTDLALELLDRDQAPTAIFAANNLIAMGVIDAVGKRGLKIPQDIALVCFDDLPNTSRLFPFLTVVAQPVYEIGVNAAQLLLSRLDSDVGLRPRQVVLPSRLIVRHSCGSQLADDGACPLSVPIPRDALGPSTLVKPLSPEERRGASRFLDGVPPATLDGPDRLDDYDNSDVNRLLKALQHQEADRVPHLELFVRNRRVFEYVLERELERDPARNGTLWISPEDHVDFALRLGMDAVPCEFAWLSAKGALADQSGGGAQLNPPPSLADQISRLELYLRAARGTRLGVIANFSSFFEPALRATGIDDAPHRFRDQQRSIERAMDTFLAHQETVMRVVCDRFAADLSLVMVQDDIAHHLGLMIPEDLFAQVFCPRMERLIAPAREHGIPLLMHTAGKIDQVLPILSELRFSGIHPVEPEYNDIFELARQWGGRMALVGNVPTALLVRGNPKRIRKRVREYCVLLAPGGGFVLSSSAGISKDVSPKNFMAMVRAVHRYGRYESLGLADS
jgi:LacI family transcriptional regulator